MPFFIENFRHRKNQVIEAQIWTVDCRVTLTEMCSITKVLMLIKVNGNRCKRG